MPVVEVEARAGRIREIRDRTSYGAEKNQLWQTLLNANITFELGSNPWDIPKLRSSMIFKVPEGKTVGTWAGAPRVYADYHLVIYGWDAMETVVPPRSILAFYTHDDRFERVWTATEAITAELLDRDWLAVIAPNFSIYEDDPKAAQVWQLYRSRWVARFFQEAGVKVIPDIQLSAKIEKLVFAGLPRQCPTIAIETQTISHFAYKGKDDIERGKAMLREFLKELKPECVFLYGRGKGIKELIESENIRTVEAESRMTVRREDFLRFRGKIQGGTTQWRPEMTWTGSTQLRLW